MVRTMQFQVPQFIEVEDKIFGPFTFRQFVYLAGGTGVSFIFWRYLPFLVAVPLILAMMGFAAALALAKWNDRPFILSLESAFYYLIHPKLYLWSSARKHQKKKEEVERQLTSTPQTYIPTLSESKLHQLSWSLDVQDKLNATSLQAATESTSPRDPLARILTPRDAMQ